jgi:high-affinity Fe2+/Pb2+ permease
MKIFYALLPKRPLDLIVIVGLVACAFMGVKIIQWGGVNKVFLIANIILLLVLVGMGAMLFWMFKNKELRTRFDKSLKAYFDKSAIDYEDSADDEKGS